MLNNLLFFNHVHNRTFMDLRNVDLNNSINGSEVDGRLKGVKWITMFYPENPKLEAKNIKFAMNELKKDDQ